MFVGEQPGDQEDREGRPFIGPAGRLLDRALEVAGVDRQKCYVTNAVKHFKWEPRGKRRLHQKPNELEIAACRPWLTAEVSILQPKVLVCLGATAARAAFGRVVKVMSERGHFMESELAARTLVTVHPSSLLRVPDHNAREQAFKAFVADLRLLKKA
jgi:DNA polymerase